MGRPSTFTQEKADTICRLLMEGWTLRKICEQEGMPERTTVFVWMQNNPSFQVQYARAREVQADTEVDEIKEIADTTQTGQITVKKISYTADGKEVVESVEIREVDMIEHRRLQVDARKWRASKMRPKVYGNIPAEESEAGATTVTVTGGLPE